MTEINSGVRVSSDDPQTSGELRRIVKDAIEHVLARPDGRRGPYLIDDSKLRTEKVASAS